MSNTLLSISRYLSLLMLLLLLLMSASTASAQGTSFTYQGRLTDQGAPANGQYDLQFKLFDAGGMPQGSPDTVEVEDVQVANGVFTVTLDFGATAFDGTVRRLELAVRPGASTGNDPFTTLIPRQEITSTPYAMRSTSAANADNATQLANQLSSPGTINNGSNPVDWTKLKNVPQFVVSGYSAGSGISINGSNVISNTGVLSVTASRPLASSGGPHPDITLSGVVPVAHGGTGLNSGPTQAGQFLRSTGPGTWAVSGIQASDLPPPSPPLNLQRVAILRWYKATLVADFPVGSVPSGLTFDGENIWVSNSNSHTVTKLRANDGANLGSFPVGMYPYGLAFDGANIWVANGGNDDFPGSTVTRLRASDGACVGTCTFTVAAIPFEIAFDGENIWVTHYSTNKVTKMRARDGAVLATLTVGNTPYSIAFDGVNIWVTNYGGTTVTKLNLNGDVLDTFTVGIHPAGIAFDGANMWVANNASSTVMKLNLNGDVLGTFPTFRPSHVAFDGENIWVTNGGDAGSTGDTVTRLRASDGACIAPCIFAVGISPGGVAFDGANIWVANASSNTVSKR